MEQMHRCAGCRMTPITATNDLVIKFANAHRCSFSRWREKVPQGDEGGALALASKWGATP